MADRAGGMDEQALLGDPYAAEAAQTARTMQQALLSLAPPPEQQAMSAQGAQQQVADNMRFAQNSQNSSAPGFTDQAYWDTVPFRPVDPASGEQNGSDRYGNPVHFGGPAPAYSPGSIPGGYNSIFGVNNPSRAGGFFSWDEYGAQAPGKPGGSTISNPNALSTNNWQLLPLQYQNPDYFMFNGNIISRNKIQNQLAPQSVLGIEGGGHFGGIRHASGPSWIFGDHSGGYAMDIGQLGPAALTGTAET